MSVDSFVRNKRRKRRINRRRVRGLSKAIGPVTKKQVRRGLRKPRPVAGAVPDRRRAQSHQRAAGARRKRARQPAVNRRRVRGLSKALGSVSREQVQAKRRSAAREGYKAKDLDDRTRIIRELKKRGPKNDRERAVLKVHNDRERARDKFSDIRKRHQRGEKVSAEDAEFHNRYLDRIQTRAASKGLAATVARSARGVSDGPGLDPVDTFASKALKGVGDVVENFAKVARGPLADVTVKTPLDQLNELTGATPRRDAARVIAGAGLKALDAAGKNRTTNDPLTAGFNSRQIKLVDQLSRSAERGLASAGGLIFEGLDRPAGAAIAGIGKGLEGTGAVQGPLAKKIRAARGPLDVLTDGRREGDITGGDITEAAGLPRQAGLFVEVGADPLLLIGAGLAPATGGATVPAVVERLRRVAPALLQTDEVKTVLRAYEDHGDDAKALRELNKITSAKSGKRGLKKRPTRLEQARTEEVRQIVEAARRERAGTAQRVSRKRRRGTTEAPVFVPARAGLDAVTSQLRAAESRTKRGVPELRLLSPLGKRRAGLPLDFGSVRMQQAWERLPVKKLSKTQRKQLVANEASRLRLQDQHERRQVLKDLNERLEAARRVGDKDRVTELQGQKLKVNDRLTKSKKSYLTQAEQNVGKRKMRRLGEAVEDINARRVTTRFPVAQANAYGRLVEEEFSKAIEHATGEIKGSLKARKRALERVQLYLISTAETGGTATADIQRAINLTDEERAVAANLRQVYDSMLDHGIQTGILDHGIRDYVGMRIWQGLNEKQTLSEQVADAIETATRGGTTTGFQRHRTVPAVADMASRDELAQAIADHADEGVRLSDAEALEIADAVWRKGRTRSMTELLARRLQRGEEVALEDLGPLMRDAAFLGRQQGIGRDARGQEMPPIFKLDEDTEGLVLPGNLDAYGMNQSVLDLPAAQREKALLLSLTKDRQQVRDMIESAPEGPVRDELEEIEEGLTSQIDEVVEAERTRVAQTQEAQLSKTLRGRLKRTDETRDLIDQRVTELRERGTSEGLTPQDERLLAQLEQQRDLLFADEKATMAPVREQLIKLQTGTAELPTELDKFVAQLDAEGNLYLRGPDAPSDAPLPDMAKRTPGEAGPYEDPFDWTTYLPDFRSEDAIVELDPRTTGYARARAQGVTSRFRARWNMVDEVYGRSRREYDDQIVTVRESDEQIALADFKADRNPNGDILGFYRRSDPGEYYALDELDIPEQTLIPNADFSRWMDVTTGQEYVPPLRDDTINSMIASRTIAAERLWPLQQVDAMKMWMTDSLHGANEVDRRVLNQAYESGMDTGFRRAMSLIRFGVTTPFPAYHIRNMISDAIKSLQADTGVLFHPIANAKLTAAAFRLGKDRTLNVPGMSDMKVEDFLLMADLFGVRSGHHVAEVMNLVRHGEFTESRVRNALSKLGPTGVMTKFGAAREDVVRYMTFLQRMRANNGDAGDAGWYMIRHHFDYNDLTERERRTARNVFLFYTWYRKNIPLQFVELVRRPGFFASIPLAYEALERGETPLNVGPFAGAAPMQQGLPEYVKDNLQALTINWNDFAVNVGFGAPWSDLHWMSQEGIRDLAQLFNPLLNTSAQLGVGGLGERQDILTGRRFNEREASGPAKIIDAALRAVGTQGLVRDENGNPTLKWWQHVLLRQVPFAGRATASLSSLSDTRADIDIQNVGSLAAPLTGLNIYASPKPGTPRYDKAVETYLYGISVAERRKLLEDLKNLKDASDEGKKLTHEDKRRLKEYERRVKEMEKRALERAEERGLGREELSKIPQSGFYVPKERKRKSRGLPGLSGGGLGGSSPLSGGGLE